ncbi:MAG: hypothetical protein K0Q51_774 [Rickettsiaceae bacterium]|jgi:hypothetical protein|nr:hypothetical protein [Rickettsiaceae bacterium]
MIKKVALLAVASVLSFGVAATAFAEEAAKEEVRCVRALEAGETEAGQIDGKSYVLETAEACAQHKGVVAH